MKVLNLYAGIGGNRKLWEDVEVTAVELDPAIAKIYQDYFSDDKVIVADAHQYLLDHYKEYDFIWSSPPCPTHSRFNNINTKSRGYADMELWQEIILLKSWFKGKYCVENVITYYEPLIAPQESDNHFYWANFKIIFYPKTTRYIRRQHHNEAVDKIGFELNGNLDKRFIKQVINNCVQPEVGLMILNCARNIITKQNLLQTDLFN